MEPPRMSSEPRQMVWAGPLRLELHVRIERPEPSLSSFRKTVLPTSQLRVNVYTSDLSVVDAKLDIEA